MSDTPENSRRAFLFGAAVLAPAAMLGAGSTQEMRDKDDLQDLHAYFTRAVALVAETPKDSDIPWPLHIRWPVAFWNKAFLDDARFVPDTGRPNEWNCGAYLVEGLGHCGTWHTPRGIAFNEKATRDDCHVYPGDLHGKAQTAPRFTPERHQPSAESNI